MRENFAMYVKKQKTTIAKPDFSTDFIDYDLVLNMGGEPTNKRFLYLSCFFV